MNKLAEILTELFEGKGTISAADLESVDEVVKQCIHEL